MNKHERNKGSGEPPTIFVKDRHSMCDFFTNIKLKITGFKFMQSTFS